MRKTFSSYTDEETWKKFKMKCIEKGLTVVEAFSQMLSKFLAE